LESRDLAERLELLKKRLSGKIDPKLVAKLVREDREIPGVEARDLNGKRRS
jgi:hypothetical protein